MKSYLELLYEKSNEFDVSLLTAFKYAGIPTSTYYRSVNGQTELRHETAKKVMKQLEKLHALQQAREHTRQLRQSGSRIDIRKIRSEYKPRSAGS